MTEEERQQEIEDLKDWIASRKADLDQMERGYAARYHVTSPFLNQMRLDRLEAWKFRIEIDEWELEEKIKSFEDDYPN